MRKRQGEETSSIREEGSEWRREKNHFSDEDLEPALTLQKGGLDKGTESQGGNLTLYFIQK